MCRSHRGRHHAVSLILVLAPALLARTATAITVNGTSTAATSIASPSLSWSHTVNSGSDRLLTVSIAMDAGLAVGITYGGAPLALIGRYDAGVHTVEVWHLVAPPEGTATVIATFDGSRNGIGGAMAINGVHQTAPIATFAGRHGTSSPGSVTLPSTPAELVLSTLITDANSTVTAALGQTERWRRATSWDRVAVGGTAGGAASVTMSWTPSGVIDDWSMAAVALRPAPRTAAVPVTPTAFASGDLDGDDLLDLVVAHPTTGEVSISLALGDGSYAPPAYVQVAGSPVAVELGDMDGSGSLDLVVASAGGTIEVLRGDGDGGVFDATSLAACQDPAGLALLDFDRDGRLDVVVPDRAERGIVLLSGDGLGGVTGAGLLPLGSRPQGIAAGDLDGDQAADLVVAMPESGEAIVLLVDDLGGFSAPRAIAVGLRPVAVALGDLDDDGLLDAALADESADEAIILLGEEEGAFGPPRAFPAGSGPMAIAIAHLDDDCALDVATANAGSRDVSALAGDDLGGFDAAVAHALDAAPADLCPLDASAPGGTALAVSVPVIHSIVLLGDEDFGASSLSLASQVLRGECEVIRVELNPAGNASQAVRHELDFGDGSPPAELPQLARVVHDYAAPGVYVARLTTFDAGGLCVAETELELELGAIRARSGGPYRLCAGAIGTELATFPLVGSVIVAPEAEGPPSYAWEVPGGGFELVNGPGTAATLRVPVALAPIAVPVQFRAWLGQCESIALDLAVLDAAEPVPLAATIDICPGAAVDLDAGPGRASYAWSTGATTRQITVSPSADTVYSVLVTDPDGCFTEAMTEVRVRAVPDPRPSASPAAVCPGQAATLHAGAEYAAYSWSTGEVGRDIVVTPAVTTRYELRVVDEAGCSGAASIDVVVLPDSPVTESVTTLYLTKAPGGGLRIRFPAIGAPGYNLHRAAHRADLETAPAIAWSGVNEFIVAAPAEDTACYQVRGASACTHASGP